MDIRDKDPAAKLDYRRDWSKWLTAVDDTIESSTWTADAGLTVEDSDHDAVTTTVWLSGGAAGTSYVVTNRITTTGGRVDERSFTLRVIER